MIALLVKTNAAEFSLKGDGTSCRFNVNSNSSCPNGWNPGERFLYVGALDDQTILKSNLKFKTFLKASSSAAHSAKVYLIIFLLKITVVDTKK